VLDALGTGAAARSGPFPAGGPRQVAERVRTAAEPLIPDTGTGAHEALRTLVHTLAEGAAEPADPHCAAHLHCSPLAVATAADLAASVLNPSLDSWDQAPAASELEKLLCGALARLVYGERPRPDTLVTTGGTESNQLALLLAREHTGPTLPIVCGANAHHSIRRGAWLLGLPEPVVLPTPAGVLSPAALDEALTAIARPALAVATAGTTDTGAIDPLPQLAAVSERHGALLHIDAAYGGPLLFSESLRGRLTGLDRADSVTLDLHKLGWQPVAAGLLAVPDAAALGPLDHRTDYLNAEDDTEAGLPDLLGRSLRTTRRPDILKIAVTLRAVGRGGLGTLVEHTCVAAQRLAGLVDAHPAFELYERPALSTVLFRPTGTGSDVDRDDLVAAARRRLLAEGRAVLGRARATDPRDGTVRLWLKATVLNPHTRPGDLAALLELVEGTLPR
jgi:L-2,4-diaminobutyrate decarboxylase